MSDYDPAQDTREGYEVGIAEIRRRKIEAGEIVPWVREEIIGDCRLLLGDCMEILPTLQGVDAVVTDPPYGQKYRAPAPRKQAANLRGLNGGWVRNGARPTPDRVIGDDIAPDLSLVLSAAPLVLIWGVHRLADQFPKGQWLIWDKRCDLPPIDQGDGEAAWVNRDGAMRIIRHKWSGLIVEPNTEESQRAGRGGAAKARLHPTQKPVRIMQWSVEQFPDARTILDPFMGSGTTLVACAKLGRRGIGIEIDPGYFDIACRRVEEAYRSPDLFIEHAKREKAETVDLFAEASP